MLSSSRPEMALAELDRAYRALENWGVTQAARPSQVRTIHSLSFTEVSELYLAGLQLLENQETWSAEHLARAVQHLAQAGWHEARLQWRKAPPPDTLPGSEKPAFPLPRPHPPTPTQLRELEELHQATEALMRSLLALEDETQVPSDSPPWPPLLPRLLREAHRHWRRTPAPNPSLLEAASTLEEVKETLGLIQELSEGILCLRLAWQSVSGRAASPEAA